jgi:hypothetical protein
MVLLRLMKYLFLNKLVEKKPFQYKIIIAKSKKKVIFMKNKSQFLHLYLDLMEWHLVWKKKCFL